jgi:D-galactose 1-dehydrogenase
VLEEGEYPRLYNHFLQLIQRRASDMDTQPLRIVADSFFAAERTTVEPFYE